MAIGLIQISILEGSFGSVSGDMTRVAMTWVAMTWVTMTLNAMQWHCIKLTQRMATCCLPERNQISFTGTHVSQQGSSHWQILSEIGFVMPYFEDDMSLFPTEMIKRHLSNSAIIFLVIFSFFLLETVHTSCLRPSHVLEQLTHKHLQSKCGLFLIWKKTIFFRIGTYTQ